MINEPTLFILGAGASAPYGFPTAAVLKHEIINFTENRYFELGELPVNAGIQWYENRDKGYFDNFATSFKLFVDPSIDLFLATHVNLAEMGKEAIILALAEKELDLIRKPQNDDWFEYLYSNFIISGITGERESDFEKIKQNKISFLTFNYDRSLEFFLWRAFKYLYSNMTHKETYDLFKSINIHHVYGSMGELIAEDESSRDLINLGSARSFQNLPLAIKSIKTIHERNDDILDREKIKEMFDEARIIVFMGFGFALENLKILFDSNINVNGKEILSTTYGIRHEIPRRIKTAPSVFYKMFMKNWNSDKDLKCKDLLEQYYLRS